MVFNIFQRGLWLLSDFSMDCSCQQISAWTLVALRFQHGLFLSTDFSMDCSCQQISAWTVLVNRSQRGLSLLSDFKTFSIQLEYSLTCKVITKMTDLIMADFTFSCCGDDVDIMKDFVVVLRFKRLFNLTLTKTSGNPGFAHPDPNDVIPARYQRPS